MSVDLKAHDRFVLRQRIRPVVNQYEFFLPDASGEPGEPVLFAEQKRFKFKEDIRFFTDETKAQEVMRLKARQRFDPAARYDVTDAGGAKIGEIQKVFGASLLRSTYKLFGADGEELATVAERSLGVAVLRRALGVISDLGDWVPIPYHFVFKRGDTVLGENTRRAFKFRDTYAIDMSADSERTLDRRLVLALTVGQDALQAR